MDILVKFEIAKLLKEKGFDKPTYYCYNLDGSEKKLDEIWSQGCEGGMSLEDWLVQYNLPHFNLISAPSITQAVMWLYKKHGVWISVDKDDNVFIYWVRIGDSGISSNSFKSPSEAYEAAINYTLNKLIKN